MQMLRAGLDKNHASARVTRSATNRLDIPRGRPDVIFDDGGRTVKLTNLNKLFWPALGITKGDLLRYYADVASVLIPHIRERPMVMKRYPDGAEGDHFFMHRAPKETPAWISICPISNSSGSMVNAPMLNDLAGLLWMVNLGCIDLNPWYAQCDDLDRPDYLHFDLDPTPGAPFAAVCEAALVVRDTLDRLGLPSFPKTTGSRGMHVYVPIQRGPSQDQVWTFAKALARLMEQRIPGLITVEYRMSRRPRNRILVDYNQNASGRTLASVYSVRPTSWAGVSTPVTWDEVENGIAAEDFRIVNVLERVHQIGDLWRPLISQRGRFRLEKLLFPNPR